MMHSSNENNCVIYLAISFIVPYKFIINRDLWGTNSSPNYSSASHYTLIVDFVGMHIVDRVRRRRELWICLVGKTLGEGAVQEEGKTDNLMGTMFLKGGTFQFFSQGT